MSVEPKVRVEMSAAAATAESPPSHAQWQPRVNPWLIAVSVMLATFMEVLDTSIASVALPHIAGNLGATPDEATWVLTSYLVSNAIILPTSAWFRSYFGRKRFLIGCIMIFTVVFVYVRRGDEPGMSHVARVVQGAGGGALQPLAQAILLESFPPAKRGVAMAVYGMGVMCAPIIGPHVGRLADGHLFVALGVLHQHSGGDSGGDHDFAGSWKTRHTFEAAKARTAGRGGIRAAGHLAGDAANHAGQGPAGGLVRRGMVAMVRGHFGRCRSFASYSGNCARPRRW